VQHGCISNTISGNNVVDNTSGGIHVAYASAYNIVEGNTIYSSRANQQGLLNCYVGCFGNKFSNNHVSVVGAANPNWHIYVGVNCSQNEFSENTLRGTAQKAYISVESGWNNAVTNPASYGFGEGTEVNNFASTSSADNVIFGNKVYPTSAKPAIFLSQVTDGAGSYTLERTVVQNNLIMSNVPLYQLELFEMTSGAITFTRLKDNSFDTDADQTRFVLPRGQLSFREYINNTYLNTGNFNLPPNGATPSAAIGAIVAHTDTGATNVTNYTNCAELAEITVRLSLNTTLVHSTGLMRLRGNANIVGSAAGGANAFVRLKLIGGVWFEQWRNF
jgi:parallel beta-helix repeat protein